MSKTRRRAYPEEPRIDKADKKYGKRGNARGKDTDRHTGGGHQFKGKK